MKIWNEKEKDCNVNVIALYLSKPMFSYQIEYEPCSFESEVNKGVEID